MVRGALDAASYAYAARAALKAVDRLQTGQKKVLLLLMGSEAKDVRAYLKGGGGVSPFSPALWPWCLSR